MGKITYYAQNYARIIYQSLMFKPLQHAVVCLMVSYITYTIQYQGEHGHIK